MRITIALAVFFTTAAAGAQVKSSITPPVPVIKSLDMVADWGFDLNRIPLNPRWGYQTSPYQISDPRWLPGCSPLSLQPNARPVVINPACTSQSPSWDGPGGAGPGGFPPGTGGWWSSVFCSEAASPFEGHSNWFPATYTGLIAWGNHSNSVFDDDDYSMDLQTPDARGVFDGDSGHVHLEFSSDETIDRFQTAWWTDFHQAVDRSDADAGFRINGHPAIATGLMGIDWVHTPGAELHPVWALAIQVTLGEWAFFVRNWGNEGYCSSNHKHVLDALPGGTYAFKLPWEYQLGARGQKVFARDVSILPVEIRSEGIPLGQVTIYKVRNQGVVAIFRLPPQSAGSEGFYEGKINLAWRFPPGTNPPPPPPPPEPRCNKVPPPPGCEDDSPERRVERQLGPMLSNSQKAVIAAALKEPRSARPATLLSQDAIRVRSLDHLPSVPASRPTTRAIFDAKNSRRDKLQLALLCAAFRGAIPGFPKACSRFSADR